MALLTRWLSTGTWANHYELLDLTPGFQDRAGIARRADYLIAELDARAQDVDPASHSRVMCALREASIVLSDCKTKRLYDSTLAIDPMQPVDPHGSADPPNAAPPNHTRVEATARETQSAQPVFDDAAQSFSLACSPPVAGTDEGDGDGIVPRVHGKLPTTASVPTAHIATTQVVGKRGGVSRSGIRWRQWLVAGSGFALLMLAVSRLTRDDHGRPIAPARNDETQRVVRNNDSRKSRVDHDAVSSGLANEFESGQPNKGENDNKQDNGSVLLPPQKSVDNQHLADSAAEPGEAAAKTTDGLAMQNGAESQSMVRLTPRQAEEVSRLLREAKSAVGENDIQLARQRLTEAREHLTNPRQREIVDGLGDLIYYVEQYQEAQDAGLERIESGMELAMGSAVVYVVERTPEKMILRFGGRNQTFNLDQLPPGLQRYLAESWLDQGAPSTKVILGAARFVDAESAPTEAEILWREAEDRGADVRRLLKLIGLKFSAAELLDLNSPTSR